ncbi:hypothetical protein [Streptomyces sp. YS-3]|uniref:hypothetical protein n=1 Tax=Streptomyces sp. YS-3 TaxID=3381352 RepID=UPI00386246B4
MSEGLAALIVAGMGCVGALGGALVGGILTGRGARSSAEIAAAATRSSAETARYCAEVAASATQFSAEMAAATARMQTTLPYYAAYQTSLDEFRRSLRADPFDLEDLKRADHLVHSNYHGVHSVGITDVTNIAGRINGACEAIKKNLNGDLDSPQNRSAAWTRLGDQRLALNNAIARAIDRRN